MSHANEIDIALLGGEKKYDATSADLKAIGEKIYDGWKKYGYVVLRNSGLRKNEMHDDLTGAMRELMSLPLPTKQAVSNGMYKGYYGRKLDDTDLSEEGQEVGLVESIHYHPNDEVVYPAREPAYRSVFQQFYSASRSLAFQILDSLSLKLGKSQDFLRQFYEKEEYLPNLRLSLYEPMERMDLPPRFTRFGEHNDYVVFTFILPEEKVGGLQVLSSNSGEWEEPEIDEDTVILLPGEVMQFWTNEDIKALLHRVVLPTDERRLKSRQSSMFFFSPDISASLQPLTSPPIPDLEFATYGDLVKARTENVNKTARY